MTLPDLLPVRMLNAFAFCPRLFFLEWVERESADNRFTVEGRFVHRVVDSMDTEDGPKVRAVEMSAPTEGLIARMDLLEHTGDLHIPVDFKRGRKPDLPEGAWEPERVQVCAQGLILRENGFNTDHGVLYFTGSRQRVTVPFDDALIERTRELIARARHAAAERNPPAPLTDDPRCSGCSLVSICLPDEVNTLTTVSAKPRALHTPRLTRQPFYVSSYAGSLGKKGDTIELRHKGERLGAARTREIDHVVLAGNVTASAAALRALCREEAAIVHSTHGGWVFGLTTGLPHKNIDRRRRQFAAAEAPKRALSLARAFVENKIRNQRTLLKRNVPDLDPRLLRRLSTLARRSARAESLPTLLGHEGAAARDYFSVFSRMLKPRHDEQSVFDFTQRNRRPPKDAVNALLSYAYGLLTRELLVIANTVGFDPYLGFLHQPRYGRPALALDLMEPFRPVLADSTVLTVINNGELKPGHLIHHPRGVALTQEGRRTFLKAYERRLTSTITHPHFGYPMSYRRILVVQTRLLERVLTGELEQYPQFHIR